MKENIQGIIKFYRDCYQREYSTEKVLNFYAASVSDLYYPPTFKLLSQASYALPVDSDWGASVSASLALNSSEKKLVCGSFFLKGKIELLGKSRQLFTPLFLHDVMLEYTNEVYFLRVDPYSISLNPVAVSYLQTLREAVASDVRLSLDELLEVDKCFSFSGLVQLQKILQQKIPQLDVTLVERRLATDQRVSDLQRISQSRKTAFEHTLFPDILIGMVDKPLKSKDVINELDALSTKVHHPDGVLTQLFGGTRTPPVATMSKGGSENLVVPVSLSESQARILTASNQAPLSLVIGPPGTGKSFSIAALAIQAFYEGKRVLIASKNQQACQVIYDKIEQDIGVKGLSINASKARYKLSVAAKLRNIISGAGVKCIDLDFLRKVRNEVHLLNGEINRLAREIAQREEVEMQWGEKLTAEGSGIFHDLQKRWIAYRHGRSKPIWELKYTMHEADRALKKKQRRLLKLYHQNALYRMLGDNRFELIQYEKAFNESRGNLIQDIFSTVDFSTVLEALPIWICRSIDLANIAPLEEGLFDLLIIDEASQCDISSSIPILYRAKSAVIVGDFNQLRHLSFMSGQVEQQLKQKYGVAAVDLAYRDRSILDQTNQAIRHQDQVVFLNEHFRSLPDIIDFSNQRFYSGRLKVMTDQWRAGDYNNLQIAYLTGGERNKKGENLVEAHYVVDAIAELVAAEEAINKSNCTGVGIISPFRGQVQLIKRLLRKRISPNQLTKHHVLVGTPFAFQGEERDVVFLSFTIDAQTHHSTRRYLERPDVFNVSITRAKTRMVVCISIAVQQLNPDTLLAKYLSHKAEQPVPTERHLIYDRFLEEVENTLIEMGVGQINANRNVCGVNIDLLITQTQRTLGIDLVGFPGAYEEQLVIAELRSLERAGIDVFLLPYSTWHFDKASCLGALRDFEKG